MEQVRKDAETGVAEAKAAAQEASEKAAETAAKTEQVRQQAERGVTEAKAAAGAAQSSADKAADKADVLEKSLDATNAIVERHTTELGEVVTKVSNAQSTADSALGVATQVTQDAKEIKQTADRAYSDAQSALTQSSSLSQRADAIESNLTTNYYDKTHSDATYATKSSLKQTSDSITATVEKTYATKAALAGLQNIADNAVETWAGSVKPSASNAPASTWATDALKKQHSGDIYYDTSTGYSYRWGSTNGTAYAWTLIKDSDITKAIADAAKAQSAADGAQSGVDKLKTDIPATYATKTEVKQTSDAITSKVSETATVADNALSKATTVEQTANGLKTTVSEQATTINGQAKTISQLQQKADSLSSTITQVNGKADLALANTVNLLQNPGFETGDVTGWTIGPKTNATVNDSQPHSGTWKMLGSLSASRNNVTLASSPFTVTVGRTYRLTCWYYGDLPVEFGLSNASKPLEYTDYSNQSPASASGWTRLEREYTIRQGAPSRMCVRVSTGDITGLDATASKHVCFDDFTLSDVTDISKAQSTADTAITRTSKLEQSLDGFKTSVSQTYETKTDSLAKKTALEQSLNGFKTTVSSTYLSKTDAAKAYATQSSLSQTKDALTAQVASAAKTADTALAKSTTVETTANGLKTTVSEQAVTLRGHTSTLSTLTQKADSLSSQITQTNRLLDQQAIILNSGFETGDLTGWQTQGKWSVNNDGIHHSGEYRAICNLPDADQTSVIASLPFVVTPGRTYELVAFVCCESSFSIGFSAADKPFEYKDGWTAGFQGNTSNGYAFQRCAKRFAIPGGVTSVCARIAAGKAANSWLRVDDVSIADVTDDETTVTRVSKLEQNLDGFKTTVEETYAAKKDAAVSYSASGGNGKPKWVRLGTLVSAGGSSTVLIDLRTGNGYNGDQSQNSRVLIMIKDGDNGTQGATKAFGVSATRENCQTLKLDVRALASNKCEIWVYFPWDWYTVSYTLSGRYTSYTNNVTAQDAAPTNGVAQSIGYRLNPETLRDDVAGIYTTKAEFKVEKDKINASVAETTKTANGALTRVSKVEQTAQSLTVTLQSTTQTANAAKSNAANAQSRVGSLEACVKMTSDGVRVGKISNGTWDGYSALVGTDGYFRTKTKGGQDRFIAGPDKVYVRDNNNRPRIDFETGASDHYYLRIHPIQETAVTQVWTTGWNMFTPVSGMGVAINCSYGFRGGILCFRGRVTPTEPDSTLIDLNSITSIGTVGKASGNRNFLCVGSVNGTVRWVMLYIEANSTRVRISGKPDWVALDSLQIPQW